MKTLDHFAILERSRCNVTSAGVIHRIENLSDHEPIYLTYRSDISNSNNAEKSSKPSSKPNWKAASSDQKLEYNDILFRQLMNTNVPETISACRNVQCTDPSHTAEIDHYMKNILEDISQAAEDTIPMKHFKPRNIKQKQLAGWKDYVEPFQDAAQFWHSIWTSAGRPMNTVLHNLMKKTRNQFHYQIRKCKRVEHSIKTGNY